MKYYLLALSLLWMPWVWADASRDFDAVDDDVAIGAAGLTQTCAGEATVYFWANADTEGEGANGLFFNFSGTGGSMFCQFRSSTTNDMQCGENFGTLKVAQCGSSCVTLDTWQFWAFRRQEPNTDCSASGARAFDRVDDTGISTLGTSSGDTGTGSSTSATLYAGGNGAGGQTFDGQIGFIAYYPTSQLVGDELLEVKWNPCFPVSKDSETPLPTACVAIRGDSPEVDLSGTGNTGTVNGATASANGPPIFMGQAIPL